MSARVVIGEQDSTQTTVTIEKISTTFKKIIMTQPDGSTVIQTIDSTDPNKTIISVQTASFKS